MAGCRCTTSTSIGLPVEVDDLGLLDLTLEDGVTAIEWPGPSSISLRRCRAGEHLARNRRHTHDLGGERAESLRCPASAGPKAPAEAGLHARLATTRCR